jgi:hypothetical protein
VRKTSKIFHNRVVYSFFGFAALWTLIVPTSFFIYLWVNNLGEIKSTTGTVLGDVFAASVVISMVAFLAIYLGMWIYLFACDCTGWGDKAWRAFLFFLTGPIATIPYFFLVYRRQYSVSSPVQSD